MNNIPKLDMKDRKILIELDKNARLSHNIIAKRVGLNTDLVRYRIHRLEQRGVIAWHLTFVNFAQFGYTNYGVYLNTHKLTKQKEAEFVDYFQDHSHVTYFAKLGGKYDFLIAILARNVLEFQAILSKMMDRYGEFIINKDIAIRLQLMHFPKKYLSDKKETYVMPHFGGSIENKSLDELDKKILHHLSVDARINVVDLARKVKTPASTVTLRMKKLQEKNIIDGFFTFVRCQSYGYQNYIITLSFRNLSKIQEQKLYEFCKTNLYIVYIIKTMGKWDFELSVEVPDQGTYQLLLVALRDTFADLIVSLESIMLFSDLKYNLYPFE